MRFIIGSAVAVIGALTICTHAMAHEACWTRTQQFYLPMRDSPPTYYCYTLSLASSSSAIAAANGFQSAGSGLAWDIDIGCEAQVQTAAATGIYSEIWRDNCNIGDIELIGHATIHGRANLIDDDCAGAALGFQQIKSNVLGAPITALLTQSSGETAAGQLGSVTAGYAGLEVTVPINSGMGEGNYGDNDQEVGTAYKENNLFTIDMKSRAYIKVWANSGFIDLYALVRASMCGESSASFRLGTRPHDAH